MSFHRNPFSLTVCLGLLLPGMLVFAQETAPLSDAVSKARVLDSQEVDLGPRSIIYNRLETPALKPQPTPAPAPPAQRQAAPTAEELAAIREWEAKFQYSLFLSVTVFDGMFSELRWWDDGHENVVWSNVNFLHFSPFADFETKDAYYLVMLWGWETTSDEIRSLNAQARSPLEVTALPPRGLSALAKAGPQWMAAGRLSEGAVWAMKDFHEYYRVHGATLAADYRRREQEARAHEEWLKANPPVPRDTVVNFFPIHSSALEGTGKVDQ
jgi:hypothetical protein